MNKNTGPRPIIPNVVRSIQGLPAGEIGFVWRGNLVRSDAARRSSFADWLCLAQLRPWERRSPDRQRGGNWLCFARFPLQPTTGYRLPPFGFVFPTLWACSVHHNSFLAQHLSSPSLAAKLGSFGAEALFVVTPQGVPAPTVRPIHTGRGPANWLRLYHHCPTDNCLLTTAYRLIGFVSHAGWPAGSSVKSEV